eukprot:752276-Hanusia_phi.AAC.7
MGYAPSPDMGLPQPSRSGQGGGRGFDRKGQQNMAGPGEGRRGGGKMERWRDGGWGKGTW